MRYNRSLRILGKTIQHTSLRCVFFLCTLAIITLSAQSALAQSIAERFTNNASEIGRKNQQYLRLHATYNWEKRPYLAYIPNQYRKNTLPLFVVLHGESSGSVEMAKITKFANYAGKYGFAVIFPETKGRYWNAGKCCSQYQKTTRSAEDDVGYLKEVVRHFSKYQNIDQQQIYFVGYSNGGMMAYTMACDPHLKASGLAVVGSNMQIDHCKPSVPVRTFAIHSKDDEEMPYFGGIPSKGFRADFGDGFSVTPLLDKPVLDTMRFWADNANCHDFRLRNNGLHYATFACSSESPSIQPEVKMILLEDAGHTWFSSTADVQESSSANRVDSTMEIIKFLLNK